MAPQPQPRRAAIYARLSVDRDGTKVGIDTQLEDSRQLARERGWEVVREYVDRNLSAANKFVQRDEYNRLVADYEAGGFAALICWDLDRLTRQPRQLEDWIDAAEDRGLVIITANGEADLSGDAGRMFARIKATVAKGEAERASARQKRNKQYRREHGLFHGGPPPYGYRVVEKTLVKAESEVTVIEEAVRRLLQDGEPLHSIVTDWNRGGPDGQPKYVTRSGAHWRQTNLRSILMNVSLLGQTKAGVQGWEPVLDQRTFDRLQALFNDPSRKVTHSPGVRGGKYSMGGGLTVCAACGKRLITAGKSRNGVRQVALACLSRVHGPHANHPPQGSMPRTTIDHDRLERYVFGEALRILNDTPRFRQRMSESDPNVDAKIDALETERADLRAQRERAGRAFVAGIMSERAAQQEVERADAALEQIERQINELLGHPVLAGLLESGIDWTSWTPGRRRTFLRRLIDRVEVGAWPDGFARNLLRKRDESDEDFAARKNDQLDRAVAARTKIVWTWDA